MLSRSLFEQLTHLSSLSVIVPIIASLFRNKTLNKILRVLFLYLIISAVVEAISYFLTINSIQNFVVKNIYTVIEFTCITAIYFLEFEGKTAKRLIGISYIGFLCLSVLLLLILGNYNKQDNIINSTESWLVILFGAFYVFKLYNNFAIKNLLSYYFTWINFAILLYFSTSFFIFLFSEYLEKGGLENYYFVYSLHLISNISFNIILTIGIWKIAPK